MPDNQSSAAAAATAPSPLALPNSVDEAHELLAKGHYVADRSLATVLYLALQRQRPLFLEGEAGVGKTEIAKALAAALGRRLIRLQCYEGLDESKALYEWRYAKQLLYTQILKDKLGEVLGDAKGLSESMEQLHRHSDVFFSERFLAPRPLLKALREKGGSVLLIDEVDKSDHEFEAFLLEILSDFQISIPELGTIKAKEPPIVVITSNRTREVHDALRRRCLYHWVDYPSQETESRIVALKAPGIADDLRNQLVAFIHKLREQDLFKRPGVAEVIDWANALTQLDVVTLTPEVLNDTLGSLLKYQDDIAKLRGSEGARLLAEIQAAA